MGPHNRGIDVSFDRERALLHGLSRVASRFLHVGEPEPLHVPPAPTPPLPESADVLSIASLVAPIARERRERRGVPKEPKAASEPSAPAPEIPVAPGRRYVTKAAVYLATLTEAFGPIPANAFDASLRLVDTLVLDGSALRALTRGNTRARAHVARAVGALARIVFPATALLDPGLVRVAEAVGDVVAIDGHLVQTAAGLLARVDGAQPFDALVVACACGEGPVAIVTAENTSLRDLARATERADLYVFTV